MQLLHQTGEVLIEDLTSRLDVSENTVRNDLNYLESKHRLRRVRGGAISVESNELEFVPRANDGHLTVRLGINAEAKKRIGEWAASMVEDYDGIVLDSSSTAYHLGTFLSNRRNLTVLTNGLHVALLLAQNPTNRVLLASNSVGGSGTTTTGMIAPEIRRNFRASKAFMSCFGLSLEQGLTETDVDEATIKAQMLELSRSVIALVDPSKLGNTHSYSAAQLNQITHLVTHEDAPSDFIAVLNRAALFPITLVGDRRHRTILPVSGSSNRHYRIGFGNLTEDMEFARQVRHGLELAGTKYPNIELLVHNNDLDRATALENADTFVSEEVDLVIEYQIDFDVGNIIMDKFNRADIPVIAIDIGLPGATFFGADNYRAGFMAGEYQGAWIRDHWDSQFDILLRLETSRIGSASSARLQGVQDGLESVLGVVASSKIHALYNAIMLDDAQEAVESWLLTIPLDVRVVIQAINDESAVGGLRVFERAGRLSQVVAVGQNADRVGYMALLQEGFPFIATTHYGPDAYGEKVLALALTILQHKRVPPAVYTEHWLVNRENVREYAGSVLQDSLLME